MGTFACDQVAKAKFGVGGEMGRRVAVNLENWLLIAPHANPGMLEMFRLRDRKPVPKLVPWAGEFAGKYLISAVQARRMVDDSRLDAHLRWFVGKLIETQADDGYLGPFRKEERLLGHWDLWGHYHIMLGLLKWYEDTGDTAARDCAIRAADLICKTYLDTDRRPVQAGSTEMNLSAIHALGKVYRHTGNEKYLRMVRVFLKDFEHEQAGDYFRQGLAGVDFYQTPRPRWESLHCIQGLTEMFLITGEADYRTSLVNLWRSMARYDRHNTGGFSTGEQAIGTPYESGAIETCCTTAFAALTIDALRLTGDSTIADELELSTWNSILGSQHPSGRWWTYNTPMDGHRAASAHTIVFQARVGTPELNCCSVNAPRGIGMLSEWAIMADEEGVFINYYGPMSFEGTLPDGTKLTLRQETAYPKDGHVTIVLEPAEAKAFAVRLRIPRWSKQTKIVAGGEDLANVEPGRYVSAKRTWKPGDKIEIDLDMSIHTWVGDGPCSNKVSLYYGPLLLAYDQHHNPFDADAIPTLDFKDLSYTEGSYRGQFEPIVLFAFQGAEGKAVNLVDFATAGAYGTEYRSWLPVTNAPPPRFFLRRPGDGAKIPAGPYRFEWTGARSVKGRTYTFLLSADASMADPIVRADDLTRPRYVMKQQLEPGKTYYWHVVARNESGNSPARHGPRTVVIDPDKENEFLDHPALLDFREDDTVTLAPLDGDGTPSWGYLEESRNTAPAPDRNAKADGAVAFRGDGMLRYRIPFFPEEDYSVAVWAYPIAYPRGHEIAQIFSAWCRGLDDPLRLTIQDKKIHARIEASRMHGTEGVPLPLNEWIHLAAVKEGGTLTLYVGGKPATQAKAPKRVTSLAEDFALGGNPHYSGPEFFTGRLDDFVFYARALSAEEVARLCGGK